jgi:hypothetical protein
VLFIPEVEMKRLINARVFSARIGNTDSATKQRIVDLLGMCILCPDDCVIQNMEKNFDEYYVTLFSNSTNKTFSCVVKRNNTVIYDRIRFYCDGLYELIEIACGNSKSRGRNY